MNFVARTALAAAVISGVMGGLVAFAAPASAASAVRTGATIHIEDHICTLGPLVTWRGDDDTLRRGALTSGHCGVEGDIVADSRTEKPIGAVVASFYTDNSRTDDHALIAFYGTTVTAHPTTISGAADPVEGASVRTFGGVSGNRTGTVTSVGDAMFDVSFPVVGGDSGGAVYSITGDGIFLAGVIKGHDAETGKGRVIKISEVIADMPFLKPAGAA